MYIKITLIIVGVLIFISSDTLSKNILGENAAFYQQLIYVVIIIYLLNKFKHQKKATSSNVVLGLSILIIYFTMFVNNDVSFGYTVQTLSLITGFIVSKKINFQNFVLAYIKIIYYIALLSIILFSTFLLFPSILSIFPVSLNNADVSYVNLFFYVHFLEVFRNTGIFREPGVYMIYLNIAILFELFYFNKPNKKHILVFVIALMTTLSTGGFLVFLMIFITYFLKTKKIRKYLQSLVFGALIVLIVSLNFDYFESSLMKFDPASTNYGSTVARIASVTVPLNIFMDSPMIGVGFANFESLYQTYSYELFGFIMLSGGHSTNTLINALATFGIIYFILIVIGYYKFTKVFSKSLLIRILIFTSFILMFSNEDIRYSLLYSTLLFYGYNLKKDVEV